MVEEEWNEWFALELAKLKDTATRKGKRRYLHFDNRPVELDAQRTRSLLQPTAVAIRTFYPFIRIDLREERYRRPKNRPPGDRRKEHTVKSRPIDFASHQDALVFSWYAHILSGFYETEVEKRGIGENVIAYRSIRNADGTGKTNIHFAREAFDFIEKNLPCHVLAIDITKFYEEIDHSLLKQQWMKLLAETTLPTDHYRVFKALTDYRFVRKARIQKYMERARRYGSSRICTPQEFKRWIIDKHLQERGAGNEKGKGIPQGAAISCVLANIYMLDFDTAIAAYVKTLPGGLYRRYSDDILISCEPANAAAVEAFVTAQVEKCKLRIKPEKTEHRLFVTNEDETQCLDPHDGRQLRLQYLGIETDGTRRYLRHASIARSQRRMSNNIRRAVESSISKGKALPKRYLHKKHAVPGNNFLSYAKRAEDELKTGAIPRQVSPLRLGRKLRKGLAKKTFKK